MKRVYMNITACLMAVTIIITSTLSLPLSVSAKTTSTDDNGNNVIKVLDMVLNKTGISASPSTIQDFFDYMGDAVTAGAQAWSDLSDTVYNSVSDYVSACKNKVASSSSGIPDSAKSLVNGYLDYMGKCFDTRANFDAGYAKGENFRNYIMSYVSDVDDNALTGAIGKKGSYKINSELVNLVRQNMDAFIEEHEGYYLIRSFTYKDLDATLFIDYVQYSYVYNAFKTIPENGVILYSGNYPYGQKTGYCDFRDVSGLNLVLSEPKSSDRYLLVNFYNSLWQKVVDAPERSFATRDFSGSLNFTDGLPNTFSGRNPYYVYTVPMSDGGNYYYLYTYPYTIDGRMIRIWKSLDSLMAYSVGQSNIYYSNTYSSFDNSVDNSITFTGQYFTSNDYSHTTIQNNIDNSQEINETTVNNIVNNYITNNYYGTDNPDGDDDSSGNWFADLITGIPQLLAALVDGLAALVESGGKLVEGITDLFTMLFVPSEGFADPIKVKINDKFYFVEETHSDIVGLVDRLDTMGKTAPTITFPLSKTPFAKYGVDDITVSFEWFEPYRMGFQLLISAILWAMFLFNQFFGIKNLIQGTDSAARNIDASEPEHNPIGFIW